MFVRMWRLCCPTLFDGQRIRTCKRLSIVPLVGINTTLARENVGLVEQRICWERVNMDQGLDPSGRLEGPVIQTYTRPFWRSLREYEEQSC